ncbi:hypothetical protein F2Q69_00024268 [Brassica cretica]|uniref:Arabidopsis retrotransposon Orf1 C-terminal domain-containing protein n=1 Tax=Brassica cretica TaxID=69181 RepID=A0A8S9QGJ3_BRACR|nr:hypothetical protein F2Q69_00024268 [Brassica cretica]
MCQPSDCILISSAIICPFSLASIVALHLAFSIFGTDMSVPTVKKTKGKLDAEKKKESALKGKALASKPAGSGTQRTSREQTLTAKKSKEQEKRAWKSVAVPTNEESDDESEDEQAPTKKTKMSKGKAVAVDRDRVKTPSVEELYDHLLNGVTWTPRRFADLDLLKELDLDSDIEAMLGHLKMPKLLTMAYFVYKDVSCQFLYSLEVTYHNTPHVRQGWSKIKFKVNGRDYNMNFKDIGRVMGHSIGTDKNSHIRHPSVRYLHRMLVHAFYPQKEAGNVPKVKKTKGKLDVEKQEAGRKESALSGKALASKPAGSGTQRTSRQQTLAAKKSKEQEKRAGKSVAVPTNEKSDDESEDEQAPTKKAKMSKGKAVAVDRDREKTPYVEELYDHLLNGVTWTPTRFADLDLLKELGLDSDIEAILRHLKMPKLLTMAYPVYKDVSYQVQGQWERLQHELQGHWESHGVPRLGRLLSSQMRKSPHRALEVDHRKQALYRD